MGNIVPSMVQEFDFIETLKDHPEFRDYHLESTIEGEFNGFKKDVILEQGETEYQSYEIFESKLLGRVLLIDGLLQSATSDEFVYHEALVQPAMFAHPQPREVIVIGGGEGATVREVLTHKCVERVQMVDLDHELVKLCKAYFPEYWETQRTSDKVEYYYTDAEQYLKHVQPRSLDVAVVDLTDPTEGTSGSLYSHHFFDMLESKLRMKGLMSIQAGSAGKRPDGFIELGKLLKDHFNVVIPYTAYMPSFDDLWGYYLAGDFIKWPGRSQVIRLMRKRHSPDFKWYNPKFSTTLPVLPKHLNQKLKEVVGTCKWNNDGR